MVKPEQQLVVQPERGPRRRRIAPVGLRLQSTNTSRPPLLAAQIGRRRTYLMFFQHAGDLLLRKP